MFVVNKNGLLTKTKRKTEMYKQLYQNFMVKNEQP